MRLFFVALQFLTRLPCPRIGDFQPEWTVRSARWFSLVGQVVGLLSAAMFAATFLFLGPWAAALLAIMVSVLATGAFHEDGLADTADGLGGGQTRETRLAIMKDSRIGTYGVLALILTLLLKAAALTRLEAVAGAWALIAGHGLARAAAVVAMRWLPYAGDVDAAKGQIGAARVRLWEMTMAIAVSIWPLIFAPAAFGIGIAVGAVFAFILAMIAKRLIGGQTGDVLGAVEQVFETGFLLGSAGGMTILMVI